MGFNVKDWKDYPDTSTPITQAALEDMETRLSTYTDTKGTPLVVNVKDYGAKGDGSTNDTSAIQAAINAVGSGTVFFPAGTYIFSSPLNVSSKTNVVLAGAGGMPNGPDSASTLYYTASTSPAVDFSGSSSCSVRDLGINHAYAGLSGTVVDASSASFFTMQRCALGGDGPSNALAKVLNLDNAVTAEFRDCYFFYGTDLIYGRSSNGNFSNVVLFDGCQFTTWSNSAVRNVGESWTFQSCVWQGAAWSGNSNSARADGIVLDSGFSCKALTVTGCWMGDVTGGTGKGNWIEFSGDGLVVQGNMIGGCELGVYLGQRAPATAVTITGNLFDGAKFAVKAEAPPSGSNERWTITGNTHKNITSSGYFINWVAGSMPTGGAVVQNDSNSGSGGGVSTATGGTGQLFLGTIPVRAGATTDGSFPIAPPDGTMVLDSTNNRVYFRLGGAWKYAALT